MNNNKRGWWCALPLAACATLPTWAAEKVASKEESLTVIGRKDADGVQSYQPLTSVTGTRSETNLLNVPQAIDVVPQQVITDQAVSSLDEALYNVSGITQANTLGGTQDAVMKRGFGDNRDGSILRDGVRSVQARNFTPTTERVEVLKGPASMLYGMGEPGGMINMITKNPSCSNIPTWKAGAAASTAAAASSTLPGRSARRDSPIA